MLLHLIICLKNKIIFIILHLFVYKQVHVVLMKIMFGNQHQQQLKQQLHINANSNVILHM